jgi:PAS domain S-box-containing protein
MITIAGYRIKKKVYKSAHRIYYQGINEGTNAPVFIKTPSSITATARDIGQIAHENEILKTLSIKGVARPIAIEKYPHGLVLILENMNGQFLAEAIKANSLNLADALTIASNLAGILGELHRSNIIHKDIQPEHIFIERKTLNVRLMDFSIASLLPRERPDISNPDIIEGTLAYMSPEQTGRMNRAVDYRTDFYSLGVTLYEMFTGQLPFHNTDLLELIHCHLARQPIPAGQTASFLPVIVSNIILKLLAKTAEKRYQSAWGLKADLEQCRRQLAASGKIEPFQLAARDVADRFQISQKLYGREHETAVLLALFDRVSRGSTEMVTISGYSGIGKTSLVREIYKPITLKKGSFITGKFDQLHRNIPYSAVAQAFQDLVRQILAESESRLTQWKNKLLEAMGDNSQIIIDIIPDLERAIGPQPAVKPLEPDEAQHRFNRVFLNFIRVFCKKKHPLVIFLDDLQWVDSGTLNLIESIMTDEQMPYLYMINAYRDNEVSPTHPLMRMLETLQQDKRYSNQIALPPLSREHITAMIADTLHCDLTSARSLAESVADKTGGNPFFVNQFLTTLNQENLLKFDTKRNAWRWQLEGVNSLNVTENIVDLLIGRLRHMPAQTQQTVCIAACIGNRFELQMIGLITGENPSDTFKALLPAMRNEIIAPVSDFQVSAEGSFDDLKVAKNFKFQHDRIHQAAYALIDEQKKKKIHLKIGRTLLANTSPDKLDKIIFSILSHLNLVADQMEQDQDRIRLTELNFAAGIKAKASAAFDPAFDYLQTGIRLLSNDCWQNQYDLTLELYVECVEAARLAGQFEQMDNYYDEVRQHAHTLLDVVGIYRSRIRACMAQNKLTDALHTAYEILDFLGEKIPENPTESESMAAVEEALFSLGDRQIEDLIHLPKMTDPLKLASMSILAEIISAVYIVAPRLIAHLLSKQVCLSINYGNTTESAYSFIAFGAVLCQMGDNIDAGYRFGKLALALLRRLNANEMESKVYHVASCYVNFFKEHIRNTLAMAMAGYEIGVESGDFEFAGYGVYCHSKHSLLAGRRLHIAQQEMRRYGESIKQLKQETPFHYNAIFQQTALNLMGKTADPHMLVGEAYDERTMLPLHEKANDRLAIFYFRFCKLLLSYLFENYPEAIRNAEWAEKEIARMPAGSLAYTLFYFYDSLTCLMGYDTSPEKEQNRILARILENQSKIKLWAHHAPMNYLHKFHLVEAEIARITSNDEEEALDHYNRAIELAKKNMYRNEAALANELTARYWLTRNKIEFAAPFMQKAYTGYMQWGAFGKGRHLKEKYHRLLTAEPGAAPLTMEPWPASEQFLGEKSSVGLDMATIVKVSLAISGEIVLNKLLIALMRHVIQNAGAQRGSLIIEVDGKLAIAAQGDAEGHESIFEPPLALGKGEYLSAAIVNYVAHTMENIVLNNATLDGLFTSDAYVQTQHPKSVLCIPLLNKTRLSGILYLENRLLSGIFTTDRMKMMKVLASQIAISIENARLFEERKNAEEKYRGVFENAVEGIYRSTLEGRLVDINPAAARMLGYDTPEEAIASISDISRQAYVNPDDRKEFMALLKNSKFVSNFEAPLYKKDGQIVWALLNARPIFDEKGDLKMIEGFINDFTVRKQATDILLEQEEQLRRENLLLRSKMKDRYKFGQIIGKSQVMQEVYELIIKAAASHENVIIYGESGTGKELAAKAIHELCDRKTQPFVPVNCGAIPENLMESEFFGYRKGAFTGANSDRQGYLDRADRGTLFLDELGEIDSRLQVKLLRVLEGGGFTPLGGGNLKVPDMRIIAATNRNLKRDLREGRIREDFFYRIHIIPIRMPSLRQRKEDIPLLIEHFLEKKYKGTKIPGQVIDAMTEYDWPGNIRELQNTLHRYIALKKLDFLTGQPGERKTLLKPEPFISETKTAESQNSLRQTISEYEKAYILRLLKANQWHRGKVAAILRIDRKTLYRKMSKHGIPGT